MKDDYITHICWMALTLAAVPARANGPSAPLSLALLGADSSGDERQLVITTERTATDVTILVVEHSYRCVGEDGQVSEGDWMELGDGHHVWLPGQADFMRNGDTCRESVRASWIAPGMDMPAIVEMPFYSLRLFGWSRTIERREFVELVRIRAAISLLDASEATVGHGEPAPPRPPDYRTVVQGERVLIDEEHAGYPLLDRGANELFE